VFKKSLLIFYLIILHLFGFGKNYQIQGYLNIDSSWSKEIYLSLIPDFNEIHSISPNYLINTAIIDSNGYFILEGNNLPGQYQLLRLHIRKKADPVSTLIIGGKEQNFVHLLIKGGDRLFIQDKVDPGGQPFKDPIFADPVNTIFQKFQMICDEWRNKQAKSKIEAELNQLAYDQMLMNFADTCSTGMVKWAILSELGISHLSESYSEWLTSQIDLYQGHASPYWIPLYNEYNYINLQSGSDHKYFSWLLYLILGVAAILLISVTLKKSNKRKKVSVSGKIKSLSIQEYKIFEFLKDGHSNKEIARQMNIEISTVKSHVNNIYLKLGVNSRKEIFYFKQISKS